MIGLPLTSIVLLALAVLGFVLYVRKHRKVEIDIPTSPHYKEAPPLSPSNPDISPFPLPSPPPAGQERVYPRDNPQPRKLRNPRRQNPPSPSSHSRGSRTAPDSEEPPTEPAGQFDLAVLPNLIQRLNDTLLRVGEAPPRYESPDRRV